MQSTAALFIIFAFLIFALARAILRPGDIASTSVIGGIGVAQIVALFYRNPLADIANAVSVAQQAKIAITSYLIGITLIRDSIGIGANPKEQHLQNQTVRTDPF